MNYTAVPILRINVLDNDKSRNLNRDQRGPIGPRADFRVFAQKNLVSNFYRNRRAGNDQQEAAYDLKTLGEKAGPNTMFQRVKKAKRQSRNFIIDVSDTKLDREMIDQQISKIFWSENTRFVDEIVIINDGHIVRVAKRA